VFLVNSRLGRFSASCSAQEPLLPKVRGQFAEFLNEGSLVRLRGVPLTHLCRFAVRTPLRSPAAFLVRLVAALGLGFPRHLALGSDLATLPLDGATPPLRSRAFPASLQLHHVKVVSDYQPILHRLRLYACGLGPTNPTRMFLASETLGLRRTRFSRALSLLIPAFALRSTPGALPGLPSPRPNAPLPLARGKSTVSVRGLSPDPLSARGHSTSELLRTLSRMAASKPTSWLSERPHLL
jgi:hypothetical protein